MIIGLRGGHSKYCKGAKSIIDEYEECQKIYRATEKYLKELGVKVINCNTNEKNQNADLSKGVTIANNNKVDLFLSIHMNAFKKVTNPMGFELWVYNKTKIDKHFKDLHTSFKSLGFKDRGIKENPKYSDLRNAKAKACILECLFVDSVEDVNIYKKLGPDKIGKIIAEGLTGKKVKEDDKIYRVQLGAYKDINNAKELQKELKDKGYDTIIK